MKFLSKNHENAWNCALDVLKPTQAQLERGLELHKNFFTMDTFGFLPTSAKTVRYGEAFSALRDKQVGQRELVKRTEFIMYDETCYDPECARLFRDSLKASGLNAMIVTVAEGKSHMEDFKRMAAHIQVLRTFRDTIAQADNADDIAKINADGRMALIWSVNGPPLAGELQDLEQELDLIEDWRRMGVRLMHLTYNRRNFAGDGCAEEANGGLSALGKDLIKRLNKCGIIVDVPHTGLRSSYEAAKCSEKPIMASHTGARALHNFIRCKDDETLKAIADGGGMVGVFAYPGMLGLSNDINALMDHVEYIVKLVGADHVGLCTDSRYLHNWETPAELLRGYQNAEFDGNRWWGNWKSYPYTNTSGKGLADGSLAWINWPLFTVALVTRNFSDEDIAKIMGQNFLRVFRANQG